MYLLKFDWLHLALVDFDQYWMLLWEYVIFPLHKKKHQFFDFLKKNSIEDVTIFGPSLNSKNYKLEEFIHGMQLKSYTFNIYKSLKKENKIFKINVFKKNNDKKLKNKLNAILEGTNFTRDWFS